MPTKLSAYRQLVSLHFDQGPASSSKNSKPRNRYAIFTIVCWKISNDIAVEFCEAILVLNTLQQPKSESYTVVHRPSRGTPTQTDSKFYTTSTDSFQTRGPFNRVGSASIEYTTYKSTSSPACSTQDFPSSRTGNSTYSRAYTYCCRPPITTCHAQREKKEGEDVCW